MKWDYKMVVLIFGVVLKRGFTVVLLKLSRYHVCLKLLC